MRSFQLACIWIGLAGAAYGQVPADSFSNLVRTRDYVLKRASSYDRSGGNEDYRPLGPNEAVSLLDTPGPGEITHIWLTIASGESFHLKKIVLRIFWDGEASPSVEAPIGDFFGLGLGTYFLYQSTPLAVAGDKALNCFFPMPFKKQARVTVTNEGRERVGALYWNIDYRAYQSPLPPILSIFTRNIARPHPTKPLSATKRI